MAEDRPPTTREVLDTGAGREGSPARRLAVLLVVLLALLGTGAAVLLGRPAPAPAPPPAPPVATEEPPPALGPAVVLRRGGPVPGGLGGGTLYLRSTDTVFRVDLDSGRVVATPAPVPSAGPVSFVPGPGGVVVQPADGRGGLLVPDDDAARPLRGLLAAAGQVLPATRGRLWVGQPFDGRGSRFALTSFDGTPSGTTLAEDGSLLPDGRGGLLLVDAGGVWQRERGSWRRLGIGTALATGPRQHLLATCATIDTCGVVTLVRYDRARGTSTPVLQDSDLELPGRGILSADGRYLASTTTDDVDAQGNGRALVLALDTGRVLKQAVVRTPAPDVAGVAAWAPAGDRLVGLDDGQPYVLDATTGRSTRLDLGLPPGTALVQLALRPS